MCQATIVECHLEADLTGMADGRSLSFSKLDSQRYSHLHASCVVREMLESRYVAVAKSNWSTTRSKFMQPIRGSTNNAMKAKSSLSRVSFPGHTV